MADYEIELRAGDSIRLSVPATIVIGRWPPAPFGVEFSARQQVYLDPQLTRPAVLKTGALRVTPSGVLRVSAVYEDLRALLVFPWPSLWIDGSAARIVALAEE